MPSPSDSQTIPIKTLPSPRYGPQGKSETLWRSNGTETAHFRAIEAGAAFYVEPMSLSALLLGKNRYYRWTLIPL
jgi:hypothetical protein